MDAAEAVNTAPVSVPSSEKPIESSVTKNESAPDAEK
jgi:hypothetical protein